MKKIDLPFPLGLALALVAAWLVSHALGGRDAVSVLSGTLPEGPMALAVPLGVLYALAWLGSVLLVPPPRRAAAVSSLVRRA
jgi:hypothetical protein